MAELRTRSACLINKTIFYLQILNMSLIIPVNFNSRMAYISDIAFLYLKIFDTFSIISRQSTYAPSIVILICSRPFLARTSSRCFIHIIIENIAYIYIINHYIINQRISSAATIRIYPNAITEFFTQIVLFIHIKRLKTTVTFYF